MQLGLHCCSQCFSVLLALLSSHFCGAGFIPAFATTPLHGWKARRKGHYGSDGKRTKKGSIIGAPGKTGEIVSEINQVMFFKGDIKL